MLFYFTVLVLVTIPLVANERQFGRRYENSRLIDHDKIVFPNEDYPNGYNWNEIYGDDTFTQNTARPRTSTVAVPGMATRRSRCEDRCQITPQYSPVCGSNTITYSNHARLLCAKRCGRNVDLVHYGVCTSSLVLLRT